MAEVDETVDIVCRAMGECAGAARRVTGVAFSGATSSSLDESSAMVRKKDFGAGWSSVPLV